MEEEDGRFELPACPDLIVVGVAHLEILEQFWNDRIPRRRPPLVMQPFRQGFPDFWRGLLESQDLKRKKVAYVDVGLTPPHPALFGLWPMSSVGGRSPAVTNSIPALIHPSTPSSRETKSYPSPRYEGNVSNDQRPSSESIDDILRPSPRTVRFSRPRAMWSPHS